MGTELESRVLACQTQSKPCRNQKKTSPASGPLEEDDANHISLRPFSFPLSMRREHLLVLFALAAPASAAALAARAPSALTETEQQLLSAQHAEDSVAHLQHRTDELFLPAEVAAVPAEPHRWAKDSDAPPVPFLAIQLQGVGFGTSIEYAECLAKMSITPGAQPRAIETLADPPGRASVCALVLTVRACALRPPQSWFCSSSAAPSFSLRPSACGTAAPSPGASTDR